jgi:putative solute:sodium symporter small subunit
VSPPEPPEPPEPRRRFPRPSSLPRPALRGNREEGRRRGLRSPREELAEETAHGYVYLRGLRRAQLQLSLLALVTFGAIFGVLPMLLYLQPVNRVHLLGVPLGIWIVVVPMLPIFVGIGWLYARRAEALDQAFSELVER